MKPGTRVALVLPNASRVMLGKLVQPVLLDTVRRWSVEWEDGVVEPDYVTYPEEYLLKVIPQ